MKNTQNPFLGESMEPHARRISREHPVNAQIVDFQDMFGNQFDKLMEGFNLSGESSDMD